MIHGEGSRVTDLPAGIARESGDLHAVSSATRTGNGALAMAAQVASFTVTGATCELDCEALAHEIGSIFFAERVYISLGTDGALVAKEGKVGRVGSSTYGKLEQEPMSVSGRGSP